MSDSANESTPFSFWIDTDQELYYYIQFWIFLILSLMNIPCSIAVIYHYITCRDQRYALHNYTTLIILLINLFYQFTDIVFYLHFFRTYEFLSNTHTFRLIWGYIDWTFFTVQVLLFAWSTIERHILIFHDRLVSTKVKRFFFHHLPLVSILLYCFIYYTVVIFASNCENIDPNDRSSSFYPCGFQNERLYLYETIGHQIGPNFLIVISSLCLLIRTVRQKRRFRQNFRWRQHRKMTIHILSVAILYLLFSTPYSFVIFLYLVGMSPSIAADFVKYSLFCLYYALLMHSVICVVSSSDLLKRIRRICRRSTTVHPMVRDDSLNKTFRQNFNIFQSK